MALIIKGDMPKGCCWYDEEGHCIRCFHLLDCEQGTPYDAVRPSDCPVIGEIPDKHGRLVEADKLAEEFDGHGLFLEEEVKKIIDFFPVVVEASK